MKTEKSLIGTKRFWFLMWGLGLAGQLCWNIENQWFNTFVYAKIAKDSSIVTLMVITSALVTTFSTFIFGTLSDRIGSRRRFISIGYNAWSNDMTTDKNRGQVGAVLAIQPIIGTVLGCLLIGSENNYQRLTGAETASLPSRQ